MDLSKKLKSVRKTESYTQKKLSELLEVDVISIQNYENERRKPNAEILQKLCTQFPEYTLWLMTGQIDPPSQIDPTIKQHSISSNKELV